MLRRLTKRLPTEQVYDLYKQGLSDAEIAKELHVGEHRIASFRQYNSLKDLSKDHLSVLENHTEELNKLLWDAVPEKDIAKHFRVSLYILELWMKRNGIPSIKVRRSKRIMELYALGKTDVEIAKQLDVSVSRVIRCRVAQYFNHNNQEKTPVSSKGYDKIAELISKMKESNSTDAEIAGALEVSRQYVSRVRAMCGMPCDREVQENKIILENASKVKEMCEKGYSKRAIVKILGIKSVHLLNRILLEHSIPCGTRFHNPDFYKQIGDMIRDGIHDAEIARRVGRTPQQIYYYRKKLGVSCASGGRMLGRLRRLGLVPV